MPSASSVSPSAATGSRRGSQLAEIHARDEASADRAVAEVLAAYDLGEDAGAGHPIVIETLTSFD